MIHPLPSYSVKCFKDAITYRITCIGLLLGCALACPGCSGFEEAFETTRSKPSKSRPNRTAGKPIPKPISQSRPLPMPVKPKKVASGLRLGKDGETKWAKMASKYGREEVITIKALESENIELQPTLGDKIKEVIGNDVEVFPVPRSTFVIAAPVKDIQTIASRVNFGAVVQTDAKKRLLAVRVDSQQFPHTLEAIKKDPSHPDHVRENLASLQSRYRRVSNQAFDRLATYDPSGVSDKLRYEVARAMKRRVMMEDLATSARIRAVEELWQWGGRDSVPLLTSLVAHEESLVRKAVVQQLVRWIAMEDVEDLIAVLPNEVNAVKRGLIIQALGKTRDERAMLPLVEALSRAPAAQFTAANYDDIATALASYGPAAEDKIIKLARSPHVDVSKTTIIVLGQIGTTKSHRILQTASRSKKAVIRREAARSLDLIRSRRLQEQAVKQFSR